MSDRMDIRLQSRLLLPMNFESGAKLGGLRAKVSEGDLLILHRQLRRAKCQVMWVHEVTNNEIQIGV